MVALAGVRRHGPAIRVIVVDGREDAGSQADVAAQLETVGDVVQVAADLAVLGIALAPVPFFLKLLREGIGVVVAFGVAASPGVAVPVPGAADLVAGFKHQGGQLQVVAQQVQLVEAGETRADDDRLVVDAVLVAGRVG